MQTSSVPVNIPEQSSSKWAAYDISDGPTAFLPPHKLSCRDVDHLSGSVPLSSSAQIRTRTKIFQATGILQLSAPYGITCCAAVCILELYAAF